MHKLVTIFTALTMGLLLLFTVSCEYEEGLGGKASIKGQVVYKVSTFGGDAFHEAGDEKVYIVYGDSDVYNDDTRTHYNGRFEFTNLFPGTYTIYAYSDCDVCPTGNYPVIETVEIQNRKDEVEVPRLEIIK